MSHQMKIVQQRQLDVQACSMLINSMQLGELIGHEEGESSEVASSEELELEEDDGSTVV